jgi:hypothetical protein
VHFIINNVSSSAEINRIYDLIVAIILVAIQILGLTTVARVMEEKRIVWSRILDEPMHGSQYVGLSRLAHGVLLVVGQGYHVFSLVSEELV